MSATGARPTATPTERPSRVGGGSNVSPRPAGTSSKKVRRIVQASLRVRCALLWVNTMLLVVLVGGTGRPRRHRLVKLCSICFNFVIGHGLVLSPQRISLAAANILHSFQSDRCAIIYSPLPSIIFCVATTYISDKTRSLHLDSRTAVGGSSNEGVFPESECSLESHPRMPPTSKNKNNVDVLTHVYQDEDVPASMVGHRRFLAIYEYISRVPTPNATVMWVFATTIYDLRSNQHIR